MTVQLEYFSKLRPIILALCLMLSVTYYVQNYAGIIGWSLSGIIHIIITHPNCGLYTSWTAMYIYI